MASDRKLTEFFIREARKHRRKYVLAFGLMPLTAIVAVSGPKILQLAIDNGIIANDVHYLTRMSLAFFAVFIARILLEPCVQIVLQSAGIRTLREIRATIVRHVSSLGRNVFERQPLGVFVSRATADVEAIGETLATSLMTIVTDLFAIVAIFLVIAHKNPQLAVLTFILVPIVAGIINWFRIRLRPLHERIRTINGRIAGQLNETISMRFEVANFHLAEGLAQDFEENNRAYRDTSIQSVSYDACTFSVIEGLSHVSVGLVLMLISGSWLLGQTMTVGEVAMYILLLNQLFEPFKQLGQRFTTLQATFAALKKIDDILSIPLPADTGDRSVDGLDLGMQAVTFGYAPDRNVLNDVSLRVPAGGSLAIVGPTGSGKTTIVRLLTRQYEVGAGAITLADTDIREIAREELKQAMVLVPQEPAIFNGSILENIAIDRPNIGLDRVIDVCEKLTAHTFILEMPDGYHTMLETDGTNLSMGQRQLIALARALVSDAQILIFDESTANIDTETERMIQHALDFVMTQKSTIIIAHRLSTIRHVNEIVVIRNGSVDDRGTHDELLARDGLYRKMYALQTP